MNFQSRHLGAAIALHVAIFALLFLSAFFTRKPKPPEVIAATIIELPGPAEAPQPAIEEIAPPPVPEPPKPEPPKPKPKPKPEPPKPDPEKLKQEQERKAAEEQKRKMREQEEQKKREELQLKAEAERKRIEEEKKRQQEEARLKREMEELQRAAEAEERQRMLDEEKRRIEEARRQREAEEQRRRDELARQIAAAEAAERRGRQASWGALLAQRITRFWTRPTGSPEDFRCLVEMELQPTGAVVSARVTRSCGNPGLDRSVEQAVLKASPMPLPPNPGDFVPNVTINFCPRGCQ